MPDRDRNQFTILRAMIVIAVAGVILGFFAANRDDWEMIASLFVIAMVLVVSLHFAIEGNRRDAANAVPCREVRPDSDGLPSPASSRGTVSSANGGPWENER